MKFLSLATIVAFHLSCVKNRHHAMAMPASPHPYEVQNADRTIVTLRLVGDEADNRETDLDGTYQISHNRFVALDCISLPLLCVAMCHVKSVSCIRKSSLLPTAPATHSMLLLLFFTGDLSTSNLQWCVTGFRSF